jgi:hypothetical protein
MGDEKKAANQMPRPSAAASISIAVPETISGISAGRRILRAAIPAPIGSSSSPRAGFRADLAVFSKSRTFGQMPPRDIEDEGSMERLTLV